jgi:hypothetical protein
MSELLDTAEARESAQLEDLEFVREFVPSAAILCCNKEVITLVLMRTAYSRVQLKILYTPKYPADPPIVELTSPTLPLMLLRNKEKECVDAARTQAAGKAQVSVIYSLVHRFIQTNLFVPCWKEIKQVMAVCEGKGTLSADEEKGILLLRLKVGEYKQTIKFTVPAEYPEDGVALEFSASNFPQEVMFAFQAQASEVVRRCVAGFTPEAALSGSNPVELPACMLASASASASAAASAGKKAQPDARALTTQSLSSLKHDVNALKQISDLRSATQASSKHVYAPHASAERKQARKELRRLARQEGERDEEEEKALRELEDAEMLALMKLKISDTAQPSLLTSARFLVEDFVARLPAEKCQACCKPAFPSNPSDESVTEPRSPQRPVRVFCGHWLHWRCLDQWLTTPPFIRFCPVCKDRRIYHPDWPADHKQLEKAWAKKEERIREEADLGAMMGF